MTLLYINTGWAGKVQILLWTLIFVGWLSVHPELGGFSSLLTAWFTPGPIGLYWRSGQLFLCFVSEKQRCNHIYSKQYVFQNDISIKGSYLPYWSKSLIDVWVLQWNENLEFYMSFIYDYLYHTLLILHFQASKIRNWKLLISAITTSLIEKENWLLLPCISIHVCVSYPADLLKPHSVRSIESKFIMKTTKYCVSYITKLTHLYCRKSA